MLAKMKVALAAVLVVASASVALADSVDGSPLHRGDPRPPGPVHAAPRVAGSWHPPPPRRVPVGPW